MKNSLSSKISLMVFVMIVLSTLSIAIFSYVVYRNDSIEIYSSEAASNAVSIASGIDGDAVAEILQTLEKNDEWYTIKKSLEKVLANTNITFLYIIDAKYDSTVSFFADGGTEADETDVLDLGDEEPLGYYPEEFMVCADSGRVISTAIYDSGGYGVMLSAYAPIKDSNGTTVAVVCVDMGVDNVMSQSNAFLAKIMIAIVLFNIVFIAISIVFTNSHIRKPLRQLIAISENLSSGKLDDNNQIHSQDEIGVLADSFRHTALTLSQLISSMDEMSLQQNAGNTDFRIDSHQFVGAYEDVADSVNTMIGNYIHEMEIFILAVSSFGKGDFNLQVAKFQGKKERINDTIENLRNNLLHMNQQITVLATSALAGDLAMRIDQTRFEGDWQTMVSTLNDLLEAVSKPTNGAADCLDSMARGNLRTVLRGNFEGDFATIQNSLNTMSDNISGYIQEITEVLHEMASGDLSKRIDRVYVGDFDEIKVAINQIVMSLNELISSIFEASDQVDVGAEHLADSSTMLAAEANEQTFIIQSLNESMQKMTDRIMTAKDKADHAEKTSMVAIGSAKDVTEQMDTLLTEMAAIRSTSNNLRKVNKVIGDIAVQTTILSLNASVEAARAGVHGTGFAIVATEVGRLADQTMKALASTTSLIDESASRVEKSSELVENAAKSVHTVAQNIEDMTQLVAGISVDSNEQTKLVQEVTANLTNVSSSAINNSAAAEESSSLSEELRNQSTGLKELIGRFTLMKR